MSGELQQSFANIGYTVTSIVVTPPAGAGADVQAVSLDVNPTTTTSSSSSNSKYIGIAVGVGGFCILCTLLVVFLLKRHQNRARAETPQTSKPDVFTRISTLRTSSRSQVAPTPADHELNTIVSQGPVASEDEAAPTPWSVVTPAYAEALTGFLDRQIDGAFAVCRGTAPFLLVKQQLDSTVVKFPISLSSEKQVSLGLMEENADAPQFASMANLIEYYSSPHAGVPFVLTLDAPLFQSPAKLSQGFIL